GWPVTDINTKTKTPLRQFVNECRGLGIVRWMARIDVCDAGAEGNLVCGEGQGCTQPHTIPKAGAIDPAEPFLFKTLSQLKRGLAAPGYSGKAHGWFVCAAYPPTGL